VPGDDDRDEAVERLLDLFLYAPIGLVTSGTEHLDEYVRKGRERAMVARTMGEFALRGVDDRVASAFGGMETMVREFLRIVVASSGPRRADTSSGVTPGSTPASTPASTGSSGDGIDDLLPGYDGLTAREIVALLDTLDASGLDRVESHEIAGRNRSTILTRIRRLRG